MAPVLQTRAPSLMEIKYHPCTTKRHVPLGTTWHKGVLRKWSFPVHTLMQARVCSTPRCPSPHPKAP